ncbi:MULTISPECIES: Cna B-type domain-containing protein [unclassified Enterococcus]|uniref:Cna B-type domain-containing protein n=1 Tax=unclassified Enterococcus TaxID=2608891 RepID=UPI0015558892|nr:MULTISPECIES: Cna B-type domain-containing protein [unclassified Enterococcus]MBS7576356.1 Cna B-type domain-containing protein [Enterococcus sp. MMGLQ5-2]MBS7583588.1 Cna B-type domain-containing protein [Enterococcus sp. MMGLQ5-1]NPD11450.1 Cna B-type domain-containing protein [Enterococcus sp. MMGLQ5-1]NPD36194.1 Cna B-type domain-containing protein [Enterococcus sp. MMGLQ5-2]
MKKLSKSGIFILMTITILLQYVSPILTAAQTTEAKANPITLDTAKIAAIGDQDVTVDLQVTVNNPDTQAINSEIKIQDSAAVIKAVANQTASKNQFNLNRNLISAQIAGSAINEINNLSIKLDKSSLKNKNTLVFESEGNTTTLDLSQLIQAESADSSTASSNNTSADTEKSSSEATGTTSDTVENQGEEEAVTANQINAFNDESQAMDISQYLPADTNGSIFDSVELSYTDANGNPVDKDQITADTKISFKYNWSIPNQLNDDYALKDGDYYEFKLPENISYTPGTGTLGDYGDYQIFSDGTVRFTFKNVENNDTISGSFNYSQSSIKTNEPGKITIDVPTKAGTDTHEIVIKPKGGNDIVKAGKFDQVNNPSEVFWDVTVNTSGNHLVDAKVSDAFPEGNAYESVAVYPLVIDLNGNVKSTGAALNEGTDYQVDSNGTVTFIGAYADTYQAFKVSYVTKIAENIKPDDGGLIDFKNTATLTNDGKELTASAEVSAKYGKLLAKSFDGADGSGSQVFNWHIDYNAGEKALAAGTTITDTLEGNQIFYGTPKLTDTSGKVIDASLYTISYSADNKTMTINFPKGIDQQVKIAYQSQVTVPIVDSDKVILNNTATSNSKEASVNSGQITEQGVVKSRGDIDYTNRTVQWNLDINKGRQEMSNWSLEDKIPAGLTVDYDSFVFTNNDSKAVLENGKDYKVTDTGSGFKVEFLGDLADTTSARYTLSFKTSFEASALSDSNKKWTNSAVMNWTDKNGKEHKNQSTADFTPRDDYRYDGSKSGSYNAITKAITWNVYTNLNQRKIENGSITDKILEGQEYIAGSATLYVGSINKNGDVVDLVKVDDVTPSYDEATRTLSVNLPEGSTAAYVLRFDTSLKNQVIDSKDYKNTAVYSNNEISNDLNGHASVNNGDSVVQKTGEQDPTDSAYALWHIWVNQSQSTVKDVEVTDIPSSNQAIVEDSIKIYGSIVDASGNISKDPSNILVLNKDYSINLQTDSTTGKQELIIKFLNQIDTAYLIEYRAYINSPAVNDVLTNTVNVTATGQKEVSGEVSGSTTVVNNGGSSTAKNVNLILTKVDKDDSNKKLAGVRFELYSYANGKKGSLLRTGLTDDNGQITWGNLKSGDYILVETAGLTGYDIPSDLKAGKKITLKYDSVDDNNNFNLTETNEKTKTTLSGVKVWSDSDNQEGLRPESVKVNLLAAGKVIDSKVVSANTNWAFSFANLVKYDSNNEEIQYSISEDSVPNYSSSIDDSDLSHIVITNSREVEKLAVNGSKTWDDNDNQDGIRPSSITVNLLADGVKIDSKVVTAADNWQYSFENLAKFKTGQAVKYTITEDNVANYTTTIDGYNLTNSYTPGKTSVTVTKAWADNNNQDGIRPENIEVELYADGIATGQTATLSAENQWTTNFTNLNIRLKGSPVLYTVKETEDEAGYVETVDDSNQGNVIITNTHTPELTEISGTKTWADNNNQDGIRPASITVNLLADGIKIDSKVVTAADNWQYSFENLAKFKAGQAVKYTITEDSVANYTMAIDGYNLTNSYTPGETSVTVTKAWDDNNDQDGIRPKSVKVQLYADGKKVGDEVELSSKNHWTKTFDKLALKASGKEIKYTVKEVNVATGYAETIDDSDQGNVIITNFHQPEVKSIELTKAWADNNNQFKARPDKIQVQLYANGIAVGSPVDVTAQNDWQYTWKDLAVNLSGQAIKYTVKEVSNVTGYTATISVKDSTHIVITNTYQAAKIKTTDKPTILPKTSERVNSFYYLIGLIIIVFAGFKLFFKREAKTSAN